jgi:hypothetical protein
MKKKLIFSVMIISLLAGVVVFAFAQNSPNVRWEYRTERVERGSKGSSASEVIVEIANNLGMDGWELVPMLAGDSRVIFKRRLP